MRWFFAASWRTILGVLCIGHALAEPPSGTAIRAGNHTGFGRLVFDVEAGTRYKLSRAGDTVTIEFPDKTALQQPPRAPRNVRSIKASADQAEIVVAAGASLREMRIDGHVVIDVLDPKPVPPKPAREPPIPSPEPAPKPMSEPAPKPMSEPAPKPMSEPVPKPVSEPVPVKAPDPPPQAIPPPRRQPGRGTVGPCDARSGPIRPDCPGRGAGPATRRGGHHRTLCRPDRGSAVPARC